jgi:hypothetical protein
MTINQRAWFAIFVMVAILAGGSLHIGATGVIYARAHDQSNFTYCHYWTPFKSFSTRFIDYSDTCSCPPLARVIENEADHSTAPAESNLAI